MDKLTMKELPAEDRPYERCLAVGPEGLTDAELLSIIIRTGAKGESSLALARRILALNYPQGSLGLLHLTLPELMEIKGIGKVKAIQLQCIGELSRRIWRTAAVQEKPAFFQPEEIAGYYMEHLRHAEHEELYVLMLDTKNRMIRDQLMSRGTVNHTAAAPRELFIEALRYHAVNVVLVHNHPSGDPTPSQEDKNLTLRIRQGGALIGIGLLDHIIIGDNTYFSFKERGII